MRPPRTRKAVVKIETGWPAPDFTTVDLSGQSHSLADFQGRKLMLSFYRYASCPLCNLRLRQLIQKYEELQARGLHLLAFFQSPAESIQLYAGRQEAPFPVIPDPDRVVYRAYGVESSLSGFIKGGVHLRTLVRATRAGFRPGRMEGSLTLVPADFLIGPDQRVVRSYYGRDIADHIPLREIESWLDEN